MKKKKEVKKTSKSIKKKRFLKSDIITEKLLKKVNKKQDKRVKTGIEKFDSLIEGGFKKNSTNLLVGSSGAGKSIFATQFLIEGIKNREKCLYITFEEKKQEFYSNMIRFGWDLEKYEKQGLFFFLEYTPEKVRTMLEEGGGTIENLVLTKKINRIVIDSITSFELLFEKDIKKRESALELFNLIGKWDCTSIVTYEGNANLNKKSDSRILDFESDAIILLYFLRKGKQRQRFLEILKMRGTNHSLDLHSFKINKKGIELSKKYFKEIEIS